jgi:DNA-binding NtrC family response regulator
MKHAIAVVVFDPEDPSTLNCVNDAVREYHSAVVPCASEEALWAEIRRQRADVVILNLRRPFEKAFRLLSEMRSEAPQAEVIFVAHFDDELLWAWMEVIQRGAYEFLPKPLDCDELRLHLVHAVEKHHRVQRKRDSSALVKDWSISPGTKHAAGGA